jgi:hypothetical protein
VGPFTLTGADNGDGTNIRAAFAESGDCNTKRFGEAYLTPGANVLPAFAFPYNGVYKVCYSTDNAAHWTEQADVSITVSTSSYPFACMRGLAWPSRPCVDQTG